MIRDGFVKKNVATARELARLACPVGLPIGAIGVHEIAVSILAQYLEKRAEYFAGRSAPVARPHAPAPCAL